MRQSDIVFINTLNRLQKADHTIEDITTMINLCFNQPLKIQ